MSGFNYCLEDLPNHERIQCARWLKGGIDALALIDTDANITDYSSAAQWQAAIDAGNAEIVKDIKGEYPEPTEVTGDNPVGCGNETILDGFDHIVNVMDHHVSATNDTFWSEVNGRQYWIAVRMCSEGTLLVVERPVTISAKNANVPMSNKEKQRYNVALSWSAEPDWKFVRATSPDSIFD